MSRGPKRKVAAATSNVVQIELGKLVESAMVMTGEPLICPCGVIFSALSQTDKNTWTCEFCATEQPADALNVEERPKELTVDYLLSGPIAAQDKDEDASGTIIFCIDTSGSMCVTQELPPGQKLKGGPTAASAEVLAFREEANMVQRMPNEGRNVEYVSRLQCAVAAIESQLDSLLAKSPNARVALVSFNSEVTIYGDGSKPPMTVAGDRLNDLEGLLAIEMQGQLTPISTGAALLKQKLACLEENGSTALGPALAVSVAMLKQGKVALGSKIILCTDGMANCGVGSIEDCPSLDAVDSWYRELSANARDAGIVINVTAIQGSGCKMEILGAIAEITSGEMDIVEPVLLGKNFANALAEPLLAIKVNLKFFVAKELTICDPAHEGEMLQSLERDFGNVTASSLSSFEYRVRNDRKINSDRNALPFQIQTKYQRLDGSVYLRVQSGTQDVTQDKLEAEQSMRVDVVASNAVQQASHWASAGRYEKARETMMTNQAMLIRSSPMSAPGQQQQQQGGYGKFLAQAQDLDEAILEAQAQEVDAPLADSRSESSRKAARSDKLSNALYRGKKGNK